MTDTTTAYHEAAHAVIGRVLGLTCGHASISPAARTATRPYEAGHAKIRDPWLTVWDWEQRERYRDARQAFRGTIIANMAGAEAEVEFFGQCCGGDGDDRREIAMLMDSRYAEISPDDWDRYEARLREQARRLVRRHRDEIELVASALRQHGTLQPDEIDSLLAG